MNDLSLIKELIISNPIIPKKDEYVGSIYVLINNINGKWYIGQTVRNFYKRWQNHLHRSRAKNPSQLITRAIKKYGWDNFSKYVIYQTSISTDLNTIKKELDSAEIEFIQKYNTTDLSIGYNISHGGGGPSGITLTEEQRKKVSLAHKGKFNNLYQSEKIYQYNLDLELIKVWPSNAEIRRQFGSQIEFESDKFTFYNSIWIRERDYIDGCLEKYKSRADQLKLLKSPKAVSCKQILQFDFDGNLINKYPSAKYAAKIVNRDCSLIAKAARGKSNQAANFIWIYKKDYSIELLQNKLKLVNK